MPGIQVEGFAIVLERLIEPTGIAIGRAQVILDIGVAAVPESRLAEEPDRGAPVLRFDRLLTGRVVGVKPTLCWVFLKGIAKAR